MWKLFHRVNKKLGSYKADSLTLDFIKHNVHLFSGGKASGRFNGPEVLCEFNSMHSSHIAYSYITNVLASKFEARIIAYSPFSILVLWRKIDWMLSKLLGRSDFAVYRSFGTSEFFYPQFNRSQLSRAKELSENILSKIKTKSDIEGICVDGIILGDLIYDSYLRRLNLPTIEIGGESFRIFLLNSIRVYIFWVDYFKEHDVRAVNASHSVYTMAFPLRIALNKDIPAFVTGALHAYQLSKERIRTGCDFLEYREIFCKLPDEVQIAGLAKAKERIELRFSGKVGVDMGYSTKSSYGEHKTERLLKESARKKVLIAIHCFFDSPHGNGNNLFPDFYEWLDFLGKMTLETDYDWYIKTHPDYLPGTMEILASFMRKYPKLILLPSDSSHHQLIEEGIDVALTCYGTIGLEYAALGILVVNASVNNPHITYDFNLHPKNVDEYRDVLKNIDSNSLSIDKNEVYEYYFMRNIFDSNDWLFDSYSDTMEAVGGYFKLFTPKSYGVWMQECSDKKHKRLLEKVASFVDSGSFRI
jgi:hypothetical protein